MGISKDNYTRLFQNIDHVSSEKTGKKQEAGVKAYDPEKMSAARKFFAKKMGIEYKTDEGKIVYLDKTSLSKFLARNKAISSEKDFNPETCIQQLKNLHTPIAHKAGAAFMDGKFKISETDLKAVCKGLGMSEKNTDTCTRILAGWGEITRAEGPTMFKNGSMYAPEGLKDFVIEKGESIANDLAKFLEDNCKPDTAMKSTLETLLINLRSLAKS